MGFDLSFSNETANLELFTPVASLYDEGGQFNAGLFYNELDDVVVHARLLAVGTQTDSRIPYQLSFGGKAYVGEIDQPGADVGGIAVGGSISIQYPSNYNPVDLTVEGYFTPGITTFGDTEKIIEIGARLSIEVVPQAKAFVGYRLLQVDADENRSFELDDNIHFGFRLQF